MAIPIGVVVSGYVKNYLLGRACRRRNLVHIDVRTRRTIVAFGLWAAIVGMGLSLVSITSIWILGFAIAGYAIVYLPVAYIIDRKI